MGGDDPDAVFVLQVKDADKADAGLDKIKDCGGGERRVGWAIEGDWAVVAESDDIADKVVAATKKGSLADDDDFKHWTDEAGDAGVVTLYAGPAAGDYLADHADDMFGFPLGLVTGGDQRVLRLGVGSDGDLDEDSGYRRVPAATRRERLDSAISDDLKAKFRDFKGMAATRAVQRRRHRVRGRRRQHLSGQLLLADGGASADVVKTLPADTGGGARARLRRRLVRRHHRHVAPYSGEDPDELMSELSDMTGLDLPADAETLAGDSAALALGSDFDPDVVLQLRRRLRHPDRAQDQGRPRRDREGARQAPRHGRPAGRTCSSRTPTATRS